MNITISDKGYLFIYVANESTVPSAEVYFDDLTIVHQTTNTALQVTSAADYYPFGMPSYLYQNEALTDMLYLYQGKELEEDLQLYDFHARMYDPATGRFLAVDPKGDKFAGWSPYAGMANSPIGTIDPDGQEPITLAALAVFALKGAGIASAAYTASIAFSDGGFDNWDWGDFGKSVAMGAVSGAVTAGIEEAFQGVKGI